MHFNKFVFFISLIKSVVSYKVTDLNATLQFVNTRIIFIYKKKTVNKIGSDDLHYARVQCALFDICSKNIPYSYAPLFSDFGRCGLCSVVVFFPFLQIWMKEIKDKCTKCKKNKENVN